MPTDVPYGQNRARKGYRANAFLTRVAVQIAMSTMLTNLLVGPWELGIAENWHGIQCLMSA